MIRSRRFVCLARMAAPLVSGFLVLGCFVADDEAARSEAPIIGGVEAAPGAWPGAVAIFGATRQICGGALVADEWVLTAAHCINPWQPSGGIGKVVIGRHRLSSNEGQTFSVQRVIRHPSLRCNDDGICDHDVALLKLSSRSSASKVKLVAREQVADITAGVETTSIGWGYTSESDSRPSDVLRQVAVPLISPGACAEAPGYRPLLSDNMLCTNAPDEARGSCKIDSGSPLFMNVRGANVQIGLTSWGRACARPDSPTVYTRVGNYLDWMTSASGGAIQP